MAIDPCVVQKSLVMSFKFCVVTKWSTSVRERVVKTGKSWICMERVFLFLEKNLRHTKVCTIDQPKKAAFWYVD